jgi:WD40 repeat protein
VRIWDLNNLGEPQILNRQANLIDTVAWSPNGKMIAAGGGDRRVVIWDAQTGEVLGSHNLHSRTVVDVAWSPDSGLLASASKDGTIVVYDYLKGREVTSPIVAHGGQIVHSVAFSPDGRILASGGDDSTIQFLDLQTLKLLEPKEGYFLNGVTSVAFSPTPGQNLLAAGSYDNRVGLFRILTQKPLSHETCRVEGQILDLLEEAPNDTLIIASTQNGTTLTRCSSSGTSPLPAPTSSAISAAFKSDGSQIAIGDSTGSIAIYEVGAGEPVLSWGGFPSPATSLEYSPDGKILAASFCAQVVEEGNRVFCAQSEVHLLDSETGVSLGSPLIAHADYITALAFNPSGKTLATGSKDKTIQRWGVPNLQPIRLPLEGHTDSVTALAFSPDGRMLASGSADNRLILWAVETGNPVAVPLTGSPGAISSLGFNSDGLILYSGSLDGSLLTWDLDPHKSIELICELVGYHDLTIKEWYQFIQSPYRHTCTGD